LSLGDWELALLWQLVCSLDEAGYLQADEARLLSMGFEQAEIEEAVAYLQSLDPPGVGAADLGDCLLIQLRRKGLDCSEARDLINHHLKDLAHGRFGKAAAALHVSAERIQELYRIIRTLDPKPGSCFGGETVRPLIPDLLVTLRDGQPVCLPHVRSQPRVVINREYLDIAQGDEAARDYVNKKLSQAVWLTRLIAGRQETVGRIGDFVLLRQREFFVNPGGRLHPLRLREAAEYLGVHESTVSRAVSGKYLQCDRGVYPLKYFFCGGTGDTDASETVGSRSVKECIRDLIEAEDKKRPLSDAAISSMLAAEGIALARRTVAKYREELMIAAASVRRT
jgi:RNA polymerase sigma-54 factor